MRREESEGRFRCWDGGRGTLIIYGPQEKEGMGGTTCRECRRSGLDHDRFVRMSLKGIVSSMPGFAIGWLLDLMCVHEVEAQSTQA